MLTALRQQKFPFGSLRTDPHWSVHGLQFHSQFRPAGKVIDESPHKKDGTITGTTWVGGALDFTADPDTVALGTGRFGIEDTQEFTAIIWVNFDTLVNNDSVFGRAAFVRPWDTFISANGSVTFRTRTTGLVSSIAPAGSVIVGTWYMIAVTFTEPLQSIYIDGILKDSDAPTGGALNFVNTTTQTSIGLLTGAGDTMDAKVRLASLYSRAVSATQIAELHTNPGLPMQQDSVRGKAPVVVGATPKGPLSHPLYGPLAGPIAC